MKRRSFLQGMAATVAISGIGRAGLLHALESGWTEMNNVSLVLPAQPTKRERVAAEMMADEVMKRCGVEWTIGSAGAVKIYLGTRASWHGLGDAVASVAATAAKLPAESYAIASAHDWIAVCGSDERGLIFGAGKLLRMCSLDRRSVAVSMRALNLTSSPHYAIRGHQLGYRPKTNAYDAWTVEMWDQYIRELAIFGTNTVELLPPISDDLSDSPHFPIPPKRMLIEMSRICDKYGLDVSIWYPAMAKDYSDKETLEAEIRDWADVMHDMPRLDIVFVPGGDPGHTEPKYMLPLLEKEKINLRKTHPQVQMWMSPQSFNAEWLTEFHTIVNEPDTQTWLDGIVFGPQNRSSIAELRKALPAKYPIRFYPDITHSIQSQYSVNNWDIAYALTEGREIINPRPEAEAAILRSELKYTSGFVSYSEGCNDDANKFLWSMLAWDPDMTAAAAMRDFGRYFIGARDGSGFAQGLLDLENNWIGPLAANELVDVTLQKFMSIERSASPFVLENWRWQQAMFRACCDAYVRERLLFESGELAKAKSVLGRIEDIGFASLPWGIGAVPAREPANGIDPQNLIENAMQTLRQSTLQPVAPALRTRIAELGYALLQSIHQQLAVERFQGEAVDRGAPLDTIDHPVTDGPYFLKQLGVISKIEDQEDKIAAIRALLDRTNPGPGGFYDELGNVGNRPHLVIEDVEGDFDFRRSPHVGTSYPDPYGANAPMAWKHWAESLYEAPLKMHYKGLDPNVEYALQVVISGDSRGVKTKLMANDAVEIHPLQLRPWPPAPQTFAVPRGATASGELRLTWTRETGLGGNGRGCQLAEVMLKPVTKKGA
ncbi:hypothetical protein P8936_02165 [Edaphobacter paludis]|uniref:Beta-hexosaminidase bacterial type N-terminal domain-containing protein n=1 Tax=Edaphobacter paludis TaxID=3035702 RepID=A0AAU7CZL6_9BACT